TRFPVSTWKSSNTSRTSFDPLSSFPRKRESSGPANMSNVRTIEGDFSGGTPNANFAIVASRFNSFIVDSLLGGALDTLIRHGVSEKNITVIKVPGAFELPLVAKRAAASGKYDAIIALGAVIRGSTPHFDYVAGECAKGIGQVGMTHDL